MENDQVQCPCKRTQCERHGNCAACKRHHYMPNKKLLPACERIAAKEKRKEAAKNAPLQFENPDQAGLQNDSKTDAAENGSHPVQKIDRKR